MGGCLSQVQAKVGKKNKEQSAAKTKGSGAASRGGSSVVHVEKSSEPDAGRRASMPANGAAPAASAPPPAPASTHSAAPIAPQSAASGGAPEAARQGGGSGKPGGEGGSARGGGGGRDVDRAAPPGHRKSASATGHEIMGDDTGAGGATSSSSKSRSGPLGKHNHAHPPNPGAAQGPPPARRFKYKELQAATKNFDEGNLLGQGSFGKVYRGTLEEGTEGALQGGSCAEIAIKKLNQESFQGYEEWLAEVLLLDKLRHPNLVRLVGYCTEGGEALLAYELCPHGALDTWLFSEEDGVMLSWEQRVKVALDAARGLAYLHENNVIHRDFKPSNVLLAHDYSGRLTDFGMARAGPDGGETHISTRVMGTMGYLDPTYMETGRLTRKSDTYAFGVMLLELLTGRRSMGENGGEAITAWVRPLLSQRKLDLTGIVDPRLGGNFSRAGAVKFFILAKHCINEDPGYRPEMSTLAENLELVDLHNATPS